MTATQGSDTVLSTQDLREEFLLLPSGIHARRPMASVSSGIVVAQRQAEVICPLMLRRNLIVAAHHGSVTRDGWRID